MYCEVTPDIWLDDLGVLQLQNCREKKKHPKKMQYWAHLSFSCIALIHLFFVCHLLRAHQASTP